MTGKNNFAGLCNRVWCVALRHGRHNDLKLKEALHSSYIPLRRQRAAFLLSASATFSAIRMASQVSTMIPSLGWRWLKHLLSKDWLGLQLHNRLPSFSQAPGTPIKSKPWLMAQSWAERNKSQSYVKSSHIPSAWPPTIITNSLWLRRPQINKSLCTHTMRWWVSGRTGGQIIVLQFFTDAIPSVATKSIL